MQPPPPVGDPYQLVPPGQNQAGTVGCRVAWDSVAFFWGNQVQAGWSDMEAIQGSVIVV